MSKATKNQVNDMIMSLVSLRDDLASFSKFELPCSVREEAEKLDRHRKQLWEYLVSRCRHCDKEVPFGCNCCAPCEDERGP